MSIEIKVPALPESVAEATIATWHKAEGDAVGRDENVVDLETDKVMLEVPATAAGKLVKVLKGEGDTVVAGDVLAVLEEGEVAASTDNKAEEKTSEEPSSSSSNGDAPDPGPAVRKLLAENGLQASDVNGTGKGGRVTRKDVEAHLAQSSKANAPTQAAPAAQPSSEAKADLPDVTSSDRVEQRVPMTRIRARIAERLVEAQQTAAMLTTFNEVDLLAVDKLRKQYRDSFEKNHGVRLGYMSFFVKATIEALKRYPILNASVDGSDIVYHGHYDIGVAVSSPRGLVVPVLRAADKLSFAEIESGIGDLGRKARDNKLSLDDLSGGTFSITNGGVFGSMLSTPILNPPQSGILGMHGINKRPVVVGDEIVVRPMMYLALTYDHRIIDGREAVMFLRTIKEVLEDPARMLLEI
nr:2-oxoglutarate dehydrogenase complex dihydrolipoyllysine-residue succinyltransferase [Oceanococcus sp. HetDA_MAG_MS8]